MHTLTVNKYMQTFKFIMNKDTKEYIRLDISRFFLNNKLY